jgi:hypothetical protein
MDRIFAAGFRVDAVAARRYLVAVQPIGMTMNHSTSLVSGIHFFPDVPEAQRA